MISLAVFWPKINFLIKGNLKFSIPSWVSIVKLSLSTGSMDLLTHASITALLNSSTLNSEQLTNFCLVSNLKCIRKLVCISKIFHII